MIKTIHVKLLLVLNLSLILGHSALGQTDLLPELKEQNVYSGDEVIYSPWQMMDATGYFNVIDNNVINDKGVFVVYCHDDIFKDTDPGTCTAKVTYDIPDVSFGTNMGAENGDLTGWEYDLGSVEVKPNGRHGLGFQTKAGTSGWSRFSQEIDLYAEGLTKEYLNVPRTYTLSFWAKPSTIGDQVRYHFELIRFDGVSIRKSGYIDVKLDKDGWQKTDYTIKEIYYNANIKTINVKFECQNAVISNNNGAMIDDILIMVDGEGLSPVLTDGLPSGSHFPKGTTTNTFQFGANKQGRFNVTVTDNEYPTASNPEPINVQCKGDIPDADITVVTNAADNCTDNPKVVFVSDIDNAGLGTAASPYIVTRTYSVTDDANNHINVMQTITVIDNIAPILVDLNSVMSQTICPADGTEGDDPQTAVVTGLNLTTNLYSDNCTDNSNLVIQYKIVLSDNTIVSDFGDQATDAASTSDPSGYTFKEGITRIYYKIIDEANNESQIKSFTVTVNHKPNPSGITF